MHQRQSPFPWRRHRQQSSYQGAGIDGNPLIEVPALTAIPPHVVPSNIGEGDVEGDKEVSDFEGDKYRKIDRLFFVKYFCKKNL